MILTPINTAFASNIKSKYPFLFMYYGLDAKMV